MQLRLQLLPDMLAMVQLPAKSALPTWLDTAQNFISVAWTTDELSIICPQVCVPSTQAAAGGWRVFKVLGPLDLGLTGITQQLSAPFASAKIPINVIATYDTDYVMVHSNNLAAGLALLHQHFVVVD
jgi:uncharacterized protein